MKFIVRIDPRSAILAGSNATGDHLVEVDVSGLTQAQREVLAGCDMPREHRLGAYPMIWGLAEPTPEAVITWAAQQAAKAEDAKARAAARVEAAVKAFLDASPADRIASWNAHGHCPMELWQDAERATFRADPRVSAAVAEVEAHYARVDKEEAAKRKAAADARIAWDAKVIRERDEAKARRKAQLAAWVAEHGTRSQQARFARGLLAEAEILAGMRDQAFAPLADWPRFERLTADEVRAELDGLPRDVEVNFRVEAMEALTEEQFAAIERAEAALPGALVLVRDHQGWPDGEDRVIHRESLHITVRLGELELSREYAM